MKPLLLLLATVAAVTLAQPDDCMRADSCGQCWQRGKHCAWCNDPFSQISSRCQNRTRLEQAEQCRKENIYQPEAKITVHGGVSIGSADSRGIVQFIEPQMTQIHIGKSAPLTIKFKYQHDRKRERDSFVSIQTSPIPDVLEVKFFINCHGKRIEGKKCEDVADKELIEFEMEVKLLRCESTSGDLSMSLGITGQTVVSGIYVTPVCGCDCEKANYHERTSPLCSNAGTLICGQCICDPGKGGASCECSLEAHGVSKASQLTDKCRSKPGEPVCGGHGKCRCGKCECDSPLFGGEFCSCDSTACPTGENGQMCSGNGRCECGTCACVDGFGREDCGCENDKAKCLENGVECSGNGHCECGKCVCNVGFTGAFCGSSEDGAAASSDGTSSNQESETEAAKGSGASSTFALFVLALARVL